MPVSLTQTITAPDYGQAERTRVQRQAFAVLLWNNARTQRVAARLIRTTGLDGHARRLRSAVKRQASPDRIKALDQALFNAVLAQRKTIGRTFSDHVHALFGKYVPWIAATLVGYFVTRIQAVACEKQVKAEYSIAPRTEEVKVPIPMGATSQETRVMFKRSVRALQNTLRPCRGRVPRKTQSLIRDAEWVYQRVVEGRSTNSLKKEYVRLTQSPDHTGNYDARRLVLHQIRLAAQRLEIPSTPPK